MAKPLFLWVVQHVLGNEDDSMNLLQASIMKAHTEDHESQRATWMLSQDLKVHPGTDNYSIVLTGLPNPDLIKNDGRDCFMMWGKHYNQYSGTPLTCSEVVCDRGLGSGTTHNALYYSTFVEACCPGKCSQSTQMNPVKYIMENKLEDEVRCLSRYGNSLGTSNVMFKNIPNLASSGYLQLTCDMVVHGKAGWKEDGVSIFYDTQKPNMRKLDGTWVYKICWDEPRLRKCCPTQCGNAAPTVEPDGPPAIDKSKYQDPPQWKSPEYDYWTKVNASKDAWRASRWWGAYKKQYEWKGDVMWYSSNKLWFWNQGANSYAWGTKQSLTDVYDKVLDPSVLSKGDTPTYAWAGGIRCEDIPKFGKIGYRSLFHAVDMDLNDTKGDKTQYAEVWNVCDWEVFAIACPGICGWTVCGAPDVGGAGNAAIPCKTEKEFHSAKWNDLPREPWTGTTTPKSFIEVGPGTPTPAPGPRNPPSPTPGTPTDTTTPVPGTDNPDDGTGPIDGDCFDAETGFGPDFSCANTDMYCGQDSGDGITVGMCCPDKCRKENERKKKNEKEAARKENIKERRQKRKAKDESRRKAERERKKKNKDAEWKNKRRLKETENKNKEDERKNKRGWKEKLRKKERGWKQNRREKSEKANKRERSRKEKRNKDKPGLEGQACFASKPDWGPSYYCAVAVDSCGGEHDDTIIDCCPAACPPKAAGPGEECFAKSESDWPGVWHCDVLPGVKNYCGCGDKYEAKVKECCPDMCIPTDTCGGFEGKKPENPKAGELKRKEKRGKAEKTRKGKWGAMREKKIKQEKKNKAANGGKKEKNQKKEKSRKEARKKKKGSRKKR